MWIYFTGLWELLLAAFFVLIRMCSTWDDITFINAGPFCMLPIEMGSNAEIPPEKARAF